MSQLELLENYRTIRFYLARVYFTFKSGNFNIQLYRHKNGYMEQI